MRACLLGHIILSFSSEEKHGVWTICLERTVNRNHQQHTSDRQMDRQTDRKQHDANSHTVSAVWSAKHYNSDKCSNVVYKV